LATQIIGKFPSRVADYGQLPACPVSGAGNWKAALPVDLRTSHEGVCNIDQEYSRNTVSRRFGQASRNGWQFGERPEDIIELNRV
jgi:hypothetical protein